MITKRVEKPSLTRGMECSDAHDAHEMLGWRTFERGGWNAHDAHEMLGWRTFERGGARNGARALAQAMYDSMYHQPGIGGPDNLSRLHLRAQSQIDHTRTVRLRIVRITAPSTHQLDDWI